MPKPPSPTGPRGLGRIRLSASPLMVAVALGMLGPAALEEDEEIPTTQQPDDLRLGEGTGGAGEVGDGRLDDLNVSVLVERLQG